MRSVNHPQPAVITVCRDILQVKRGHGRKMDACVPGMPGKRVGMRCEGAMERDTSPAWWRHRGFPAQVFGFVVITLCGGEPPRAVRMALGLDWPVPRSPRSTASATSRRCPTRICREWPDHGDHSRLACEDVPDNMTGVAEARSRAGRNGPYDEEFGPPGSEPRTSIFPGDHSRIFAFIRDSKDNSEKPRT